jgi:hypothetical protein
VFTTTTLVGGYSANLKHAFVEFIDFCEIVFGEKHVYFVKAVYLSKSSFHISIVCSLIFPHVLYKLSRLKGFINVMY